MIDAFALASSRPWMIQAEALENILSVADRMGDPEALATRLGRPLDNARKVSMRDGVAVIPVTGPIFRYANLFSEISGATSTQVLATDIQAALDNSYVRGIVLDINSPGGDATGIAELGAMIRAARSKKPIKAYAGGAMASAAYWIGSAADEIIIDETAILGSIGVVMSGVDTTERDAKAGVRRIEIVSSRAPNKRVDPQTDEGRANVLAIVNALEDVFVGAVAANRGVSTDKVLTDFGQGGVLVGAAAIKAGMADRLGSLETVIAELAGSASTAKRNTSMNDQKGKVTVSNTDDLRTALAAGYTGDQISIAQASSQEAIAHARTEGIEEGRKASADALVAGERKRIADIQAMGRPGFDAELKAAIDSGASPEAFAMSMLKAAQDRGITLEAIRKDAPPAAPHAKPGDTQGGGKKLKSSSEVFAARRQASATAAASSSRS